MNMNEIKKFSQTFSLEKINPNAAIVLVASMAFFAICRMNGGS